MTKDLTVKLEDRPGTLADMGEALSKAGINMDGICGVHCKDETAIHILVEDADGARRALEASGIEVSDERDVLVVEVEDRPGTLGDVARSIANAGVNIELVYLAANTRLVIGVDDLDTARAAV